MTDEKTVDGALAKVEQPERTPVSYGRQGFGIKSLEEAFRFGQYVAKSKFFKALTQPEQVVVTLQLANDNGVPFSLVASNIAFINGKACMFGDALIGIAWSNPNCADIAEKLEGEGDGMVATCTVKRKGAETPIVRSFSMADAKLAGLAGKDVWKNYPQRMLQMRARSWALRDAGLVQGIMTSEEVEDYVPAVAEPIRDGVQSFKKAHERGAIAAPESPPEPSEPEQPPEVTEPEQGAPEAPEEPQEAPVEGDKDVCSGCGEELTEPNEAGEQYCKACGLLQGQQPPVDVEGDGDTFWPED